MPSIQGWPDEGHFFGFLIQFPQEGPAGFPAHVATASRPQPRFSLSEVIIHEDENFERALKRFKKKCEKAGILSDLRKHRHYEKPSERRKRKMNAAVRKNRRTRNG
jgi:small subunit ribosomal protein S21